MPVPIIVIEITAERPAPQHLPALVDACNRSALGARCVLEMEPHTRPDAVAIVHWEEDSDRVRIEVGVRHGERNDWRVREFSFRENDELSERWRAVGFAIGTLASRESSQEPPQPEPPEPAAPPEPAPPPTTETPEKPLNVRNVRADSEVWLEAGPFLGPGIEGGAWRIGGMLAASWRPNSAPVFVTIATRAALSPTERTRGVELDARFLDFSSGLGFRLVSSRRLGVLLSAQVVTEYFAVSAASENVPTDTQSRWLLGGRLLSLAHYMLTRELGAYVSADAVLFGGSTDIRLRNAPFGTMPEFRYAFGLGMRVQLR